MEGDNKTQVEHIRAGSLTDSLVKNLERSDPLTGPYWILAHESLKPVALIPVFLSQSKNKNTHCTVRVPPVTWGTGDPNEGLLVGGWGAFVDETF